ncbi:MULTISPECIES: c-type cytochrome [unclassified Psychrobacter]|uniref:c-type cytochrome n=1 Tax=unclassified Psychrobacter TaxID=196806 RepID=UPI0025B371A2|nr:MULTISPECIES: c-type cytochrome [unclassified Psychrobacter]MDN3454179.1 c-type cytochrome [Psychrobacter sp. APC 3350]MDN3501426.1 c-type cytochrome [Psychrobacter sp. 5A.1]
MNKLRLSVISMSAILALSACSGDNTTTEAPTAANEPATAVEEITVAEPEVTTPEPVIESEPKTETETESTDRVVEEEVVPEVAVDSDIAAEPEVLAADAGAKLYESNCQVCHAAGLLNAPKYGDTAAWAARLTKDKETLYMHSVKGFNKMPAQAVNGVTEAQVKAAVDYMLASVS